MTLPTRSNRGPYYLKNSEGIQNKKGLCCRSNRGQNILEHIVLVAMVIVILVIFLNPHGPFAQRMENSVLNAAVSQVSNLSDEIQF